MKGLLIKDILTMKKTLGIYLALVAFYGFLGLSDGNSGLMGGFLCVFSALIPVTAFSYEERSHWYRYAAALPLTRKQMVGEKYLLGLLFSALGFGVLLGYIALIPSPFTENFLLSLVFLLYGLLIQAVLFPLTFRFGSEKARLFLLPVAALPLLLCFGLAKAPALRDGLYGLLPYLPYGGLPLGGALWVGSLFLSFRIFSQRDL